MGLLALNRLMSMHRDRRRRPTQAHGLATSSVAKRKGSPCLRDHNSRRDKRSRYSVPSFPEAIWHHIYTMLPMRDAARVACVSRSFQSSWRCFPNLSLTRETLGLKDKVNEITSKIEAVKLARKTDHIMKKHSGIGVKELKLEVLEYPVFSTSSDDLDRWLGIAVKPGIERLYLQFCSPTLFHPNMYNFPLSLLLGGWGNSIRKLRLTKCAFRPTTELDCLRSLTSLKFDNVRITGDELRYLLSGSVALEKLKINTCNELIFLEIPSVLHRLSHLVVNDCFYLEVIKSEAPNLHSFEYMGALPQLSLGDSLQDLDICALGGDVVHYAGANLPSMVPNLEALYISSYRVTDAVVVPGRFLHLQQLGIAILSSDYDYLSLVSFLDGCPSLETFSLSVKWDRMEQESVLGESSHDLRRMPGHFYRNLKDVHITGFCSAISVVELTCHMLENAKSLECLTLSTCLEGEDSCSDGEYDRCFRMSKDRIMEAHKAPLVVKKYILGKVTSAVELKVIEPCSRCNALEI